MLILSKYRINIILSSEKQQATVWRHFEPHSCRPITRPARGSASSPPYPASSAHCSTHPTTPPRKRRNSPRANSPKFHAVSKSWINSFVPTKIDSTGSPPSTPPHSTKLQTTITPTSTNNAKRDILYTPSSSSMRKNFAQMFMTLRLYNLRS